MQLTASALNSLILGLQAQREVSARYICGAKQVVCFALKIPASCSLLSCFLHCSLLEIHTEPFGLASKTPASLPSPSSRAFPHFPPQEPRLLFTARWLAFPDLLKHLQALPMWPGNVFKLLSFRCSSEEWSVLKKGRRGGGKSNAFPGSSSPSENRLKLVMLLEISLTENSVGSPAPTASCSIVGGCWKHQKQACGRQRELVLLAQSNKV